MPRLELIDVPLYGPNDPVHWNTDNVPLKALMSRQNLINLSLDDVIKQIRDAVGTQNTIGNRLNQSINADGSLKKQAIDDTNHSIEEHADTNDYVRMTKSQSDKLDLIADEAKDLSLRFTDGSATVTLDDGIVDFQPSSSVSMSITSPNIVKFDLAFPASAAHQHFYGLVPVDANAISPDLTNYKVNSSSSKFIEDSLRVYINGVRIFSDVEVYVPGPMVEDAWTLLSFTPDNEAGTFSLSSALSEEDIITIDFDIALV